MSDDYSEVGQVAAVEVEEAGGNAIGDHPAGTTTIQLDDASDFPEIEAQARLDVTVVDVASVNTETDVITLAAPSPVAVEDGERVFVHPSAPTTWAHVIVDPQEPALQVEVPFGIKAFTGLEPGDLVRFRESSATGALTLVEVIGADPTLHASRVDDAEELLLADQQTLGEKLAESAADLEAARTRLTAAEQRLTDAFSEIDLLPDTAYVAAAKQQAIDAAAITAQQKADQAKADAIADAQGKLAVAETELEAAIASGDQAAISAAQQKADAARDAAIAAAATDATTKANAARDAAIAAAASDATAKATEAMNKAAAALTAAESAQATADNAIRTYYSSEPPWANGSAQPDDVLGDMWFDTDDGQAYRWSGAAWTVIRDQGIGEALAAAQDAQTTADGKIAAFYQGNEPLEADEGDLWFDTDNGNRVYRRTSSTWVDVADARIAQQATALADVQQDITGLEGTLDGKSNVWVQAAQPSGLGATDKGDIWINDGATPRTTKVWTGTAWIDADSRITQAVTDITKKITTYYTATTTAPTGTFVDGDLWIDVNGKIARRNGSSWVTVSDPKALADAALAAAKADATAKADAAREAAKTAAAADATAKAEAAEAAAAATAAADATAKANQAKADAEAAAKTYADTVSSGASGDALAAAKTYAEQQAAAAELAAKQAAAADATAKAEAAQAEAARLAALDATAKADAAEAAAKEAGRRTMKEWMTNGDDAALYKVSIGTTPTSAAIADASGGRALVSTTSTTWGSFPEATMAFSPTTLYRVSARVRRTSGTGSFYLGVDGLAANGTTLVNATGANTTSSQHYLISSVQPTAEWQVYTGFLRGYGTPNSGGLRTLASPLTAHADVRFIRPMMILNYQAAGVTEVDWVRIEAMEPDERIDAAETNAKAFATTRTDGLAKTLWSTALPGTTTAPQNSVWYRTDASGKIIAVFTQTAAGTAASWSARPIKSEAIDNLDVGKLTAASGTINQLVANAFAAKLADIIQANIGNLTVTGDTHLNNVVAQTIAGDTASFIRLTVDQVLAGNIEAVWNIVAGGKIIAGDPNGARVEIAPDGIRLYAIGFNGQPYEAVSMVNGRIAFSVVDQTRGVIAGISAEGDVTGQAASFAKGVTVRGTDLTGQLGGGTVPGLLDVLPRGIVPGGLRSVTTAGTAASGEIISTTLRVTLEPGRLYRVVAKFTGRVSTSTGVIRLRLRRTLDTGARPTTSSPIFGDEPLLVGYNSSVSVSGSCEAIFTRSTRTDMVVSLTYQGLNGSTAQREWTQIYVEDLGLRSVDFGGDDDTPKTTYTTAWAATASRGYTKTGATIGSKENKLSLWYFGSTAAESAAVLFGGTATTFDNASESGRTLPQALNGATIHSVELELTNAMWWNKSIRNLGVNTLGGNTLPSTKVVEGSAFKGDIPEGGTVRIPLDPAWFLNGTNTGVTIGDKDGDMSVSGATYQMGAGELHGPADPNPPRLIVTYSR